MAFETGSATGRDDLLAKLKTFLEGDGWTTNKYESDGTGYRLHISKDDVYANLRSTYNETAGYSASTGIALQLSLGFDAGLDWDGQPGYPGAGGSYPYVVKIVDITGAIPHYWFFSNGTQIDVVLDLSVSEYASLHWGELVKCGNYAGGQYFTANTYLAGDSNSLHCPFHKYTLCVHAAGTWYGYYPSSSLDMTMLFAPYKDYYYDSESFLGYLVGVNGTLNGVKPLLPLYMAINGDSFAPLGWPEHIRCITGGFDVGEEITLGADTWVVLPTECPDNFAIRKTV